MTTGNRERGTGNRERGTGNGEPGAGNGEPETGHGDPEAGNREQGAGRLGRQGDGRAYEERDRLAHNYGGHSNNDGAEKAKERRAYAERGRPPAAPEKRWADEAERTADDERDRWERETPDEHISDAQPGGEHERLAEDE